MIFMIFSPSDLLFWLNTQHRNEVVLGSHKKSQAPKNLALMRIGVDTIN